MISASRRRRLLMQVALNYFTARRRQLLHMSLVLLLLISAHRIQIATATPSARSRLRSCRRLNRNTAWWQKIWGTYSDARFKKTFRVSRPTFNFILSRIRHRLLKQVITEEPISPEERLGICLYRLARGDYHFTIAEMVGRGVATVYNIVHEVSEVLVDELWTESVTTFMPATQDEFKANILDMDEFWQFPCYWSAIDGCHIPMKCPPGGLEACKEYHNFKNFYSVVLMGMVDSHYRFVWASCGFPGNSNDAIIFKSTDIWGQSRMMI